VETLPADSRAGAPTARRDDDITAVSSVAYGFMGSQALFAALELGLFTELAAGPVDLEELARRLGTEPRPLRALLEACVATELAQAYLPSGGGLVIHDFALHGDRPGPRNAALWFFANLAISEATHPHTVDGITRAMSGAGFAEVTARPHIPDITFAFSGRRG
jgi:hypothetical protein